MSWQEPKTDWVAGNVPVPSDFNRIEGNIEEVINYIEEVINYIERKIIAKNFSLSGRTGSGVPYIPKGTTRDMQVLTIKLQPGESLNLRRLRCDLVDSDLRLSVTSVSSGTDNNFDSGSYQYDEEESVTITSNTTANIILGQLIVSIKNISTRNVSVSENAGWHLYFNIE